MSNDKRIFDLEERLIDFAISIIRISESLPKSKVGNHISGQLIRGGTSPASNYGEAKGAESRSDFIHNSKSHTWLRACCSIFNIQCLNTLSDLSLVF